MIDLLTKIHKFAKVTGSQADGTATELSDIDFYIPERNWEQLKQILRELKIKCDSCVIGHIATINFNPMLEFSYLFDKRPNRKNIININGFDFKTW